MLRARQRRRLPGIPDLAWQAVIFSWAREADEHQPRIAGPSISPPAATFRENRPRHRRSGARAEAANQRQAYAPRDHPTGNRYLMEESGGIGDGGASIYVGHGSMYCAAGSDHPMLPGEAEFAFRISATAGSGKQTSACTEGYMDHVVDGERGEFLDKFPAANCGFLDNRQPGNLDADPAVMGTFCAGAAGRYLEPAFQRNLARVKVSRRQACPRPPRQRISSPRRLGSVGGKLTAPVAWSVQPPRRSAITCVVDG
jgi:hypothetical protein